MKRIHIVIAFLVCLSFLGWAIARTNNLLHDIRAMDNYKSLYDQKAQESHKLKDDIDYWKGRAEAAEMIQDEMQKDIKKIKDMNLNIHRGLKRIEKQNEVIQPVE